MSDNLTTSTRIGPNGEMQFYDKVTGITTLELGAVGGLPRFAKKTLTSAQILALNATPVTILPAPGAGMANYIIDAVLYLNFATTQYANGSAVTFVQGGITVFSTTAALVNGGAAVLIQPAFPAIGTTASLGVLNSALTANASVAFITGDSTLDVMVWYSTILVP